MCWTYTYSMYTTRTSTRNFARLIANLGIHAESVCRRPRCLPSPRFFQNAAFWFDYVLFYLGDLYKRTEKNNRASKLKKILILDGCVTFVNETYWIPLCTTMRMFFTKFTAERCPRWFSVCIQADNGLVHTQKKSAPCSQMHLCVHSKSKYKLETPCSAVDNGCSVDNYCSSGLGISDSQLVRPKKNAWLDDSFNSKGSLKSRTRY